MTQPLPKIETFRSTSQTAQGTLGGLLMADSFNGGSNLQMWVSILMMVLPMIDAVFQQWQMAQKPADSTNVAAR